MQTQEKTLDDIKEYYGQTLETNDDLKTTACCTMEVIPVELRDILKEIHVDIKKKFYGCGSPIPKGLAGKTVLDLGCGSGRDCYLLSKLVGEKGHVIGLDMTDEQLAVAKEYEDYHRETFGYEKSNVKFVKGYIEDLKTAGIADNSVDVVVSNCVLNLSPEKTRVFSEIFRVLKPGGELYFSDVFSDRRIPQELLNDPVLRGECLSGALYTEDFRRAMAAIGCLDYRVMSSAPIDLKDPEVEAKLGMVKFRSITMRAFKLALEDRCEDFGQMATYKGNLAGNPHSFVLDDHHLFQRGKPEAVCANTALMLSGTRFAQYFDITGDTKTHYGLFDCGPESLQTALEDSGACC